tara:strand:+ start:188 stop:733 length:546 start_codon:yes stop_codon:yes gene_type:complete
MSYILYYSNYCQNCGNILSVLSKSNIKNNINFLCIDKRINKNNKTYIILENNIEILLPTDITSVPSLLVINQNYKIITGEDILKFLNPINEEINNKATNNNGEPETMNFLSNNFGVMSDSYSYLDQNSDQMSTKGDGGLRQLYNYSQIDSMEKIETPPDNYVADKIGEVNMDDLQKSRNIN